MTPLCFCAVTCVGRILLMGVGASSVSYSPNTGSQGPLVQGLLWGTRWNCSSGVPVSPPNLLQSAHMTSVQVQHPNPEPPDWCLHVPPPTPQPPTANSWESTPAHHKAGRFLLLAVPKLTFLFHWTVHKPAFLDKKFLLWTLFFQNGDTECNRLADVANKEKKRTDLPIFWFF